MVKNEIVTPASGKPFMLVESRSKPGTYHRIYVDEYNQLHCGCKGYTYRGSCHHIEKYGQKLLNKVKNIESCL